MASLPPDDPEYHDGRDDLAALEFFAPADEDEQSGLAAFDDYVAEPQPEEMAAEQTVDELPVPLFTVTNPPGTVTVSSFMDGRVQQIDLSPEVRELTERDLADEIVFIAGLASEHARSAQYAFMLEGMREAGHDNVATRDFLTRELKLPTPEQAEATRAQLFATRYASDHE